MPDARPLASPETPATSRALPRLIVPAVLVAIAAGVIIIAPLLLDTYLVNILVRACFVAIAAITVDIMWG